jgi:hypothetical protein
MSGSKLEWNHPVCSTCLFFMSGSKLSDGIILYAQICLFFMSGSKLLDGNPLYVQFVYFMSGSKILD